MLLNWHILLQYDCNKTRCFVTFHPCSIPSSCTRCDSAETSITQFFTHEAPEDAYYAKGSSLSPGWRCWIIDVFIYFLCSKATVYDMFYMCSPSLPLLAFGHEGAVKVVNKPHPPPPPSHPPTHTLELAPSAWTLSLHNRKKMLDASRFTFSLVRVCSSG